MSAWPVRRTASYGSLGLRLTRVITFMVNLVRSNDLGQTRVRQVSHLILYFTPPL